MAAQTLWSLFPFLSIISYSLSLPIHPSSPIHYHCLFIHPQLFILLSYWFSSLFLFEHALHILLHFYFNLFDEWVTTVTTITISSHPFLAYPNNSWFDSFACVVSSLSLSLFACHISSSILIDLLPPAVYLSGTLIRIFIWFWGRYLSTFIRLSLWFQWFFCQGSTFLLHSKHLACTKKMGRVLFLEDLEQTNLLFLAFGFFLNK